MYFVVTDGLFNQGVYCFNSLEKAMAFAEEMEYAGDKVTIYKGEAIG